MKRIVCLLILLSTPPALADGNPQKILSELAEVGDKFTFLVNADPQIGPSDSPHANERHLYQLLRDFVTEANDLSPSPAFVLFNGDLVAHNRPPYFAAFGDLASQIRHPVALVHGNHDGGHNEGSFGEVQQRVSGFQALRYSFDCGRWHFVVLPSPEKIRNSRGQQEILEWLDADLKANRGRPTMLFLHYHLLPVGLSQLEYYALQTDLKNALIEAIARHGNVRYVIMGHVHAGIKASIKTAWSYKGTRYVVAPSPVAPRCFGEEYPEFLDGGAREEGYYLVVDIDGDKAVLKGRKTGHTAEKVYPQAFPEFSPADDPRALQRVSEMKPRESLLNGGFEDGLDGWLRPHRYLADESPAFVWKASGEHKRGGARAAYLYCREKGNAWAYDESIELYQLVAVPAGAKPVLRAAYCVPLNGRSPFGGGYIRLTAYAGTEPRIMMLFHWGARENRVRHLPQIFSYLDAGQSKGHDSFQKLAEQKRLLCWSVPDYPDRWQSAQVNMAELYDRTAGRQGAFAEEGIQKVLVAFGVWCGMEPGSLSAAWFDEFAIEFGGEQESEIAGRPVPMSPRVFQPVYGLWYLDGYDK